MFTYDSSGNLLTEDAEPGADASYRAGLAFNPVTGALYIGGAGGHSVNGLSVDGKGRVQYDSGAPAVYHHGWPLSAVGAIIAQTGAIAAGTPFINGAFIGGSGVFVSDAGGSWSPSALFASSEVGVWYDPSDLSTMFQNSDGTTAVEVGDPVGYIADKSGNGFHATQVTSTARPILGRHPITGRRNLLTYTEDLANAVWVKSATTVATGNILTAIAGAAVHRISSASTTAPGTVWLDVKAGTHAFFQIANGSTSNAFANFDLVSGVVGTKGTAALSSSITSLGNGVYRCIVVWSGTPNTNNMLHIVSSASAAWAESWTALGTETIEFVKAQVELGSTPTAYQKVVSTYDVTEAGVADAYHLEFDGVDDFLVTSAIDFSATDKASVFAGIYKASDAAAGGICGHGITGSQVGAFYLTAPRDSTYEFGIAYRVTAGGNDGYINDAGFAAPFTSVNTGLIDFSAASSAATAKLRVNGVQQTLTFVTERSGAPSLLNTAIDVGRANNSNPFNGRIYSIIVRAGLSDATEIDNAEAYVAGKTGVTL